MKSSVLDLQHPKPPRSSTKRNGRRRLWEDRRPFHSLSLSPPRLQAASCKLQASSFELRAASLRFFSTFPALARNPRLLICTYTYLRTYVHTYKLFRGFPVKSARGDVIWEI